MKKVKVDLYNLMAKKNIRTISKLARETGLSNKAISAILNHETQSMKFSTVLKLCRYFDCELHDLLIIETDE